MDNYKIIYAQLLDDYPFSLGSLDISDLNFKLAIEICRNNLNYVKENISMRGKNYADIFMNICLRKSASIEMIDYLVSNLNLNLIQPISNSNFFNIQTVTYLSITMSSNPNLPIIKYLIEELMLHETIYENINNNYLYYCCKNPNIEIIKYFFDNEEINITSKYLEKVLITNNVEAVSFFISKIKDIKCIEPNVLEQLEKLDLQILKKILIENKNNYNKVNMLLNVIIQKQIYKNEILLKDDEINSLMIIPSYHEHFAIENPFDKNLKNL